MIKENQKLLNNLNVITDGLVILLLLPFAFWVRFYVLPGGIITVPFPYYVALALILAPVHLFTYASFGLYESFRTQRLYQELYYLTLATALDAIALLTILFVRREFDYSRVALGIFYLLVVILLSVKRVLLRLTLRYYRKKGYNQKHILVVGTGKMARRYIETVRKNRDLGYYVVGYVGKKTSAKDVEWLGGYDLLAQQLEHVQPDEVVVATSAEDYPETGRIIMACEQSGVKVSLIPFYAEYMPSNPQFDDVDGLPLMNIRRVPLDNWANAFLKRTTDIVGALVLIVLSSPLMLLASVGVKLSSPGPVIFRQERVGRFKAPFYMYKFRSMRVNGQQNTGWSRDSDDRKTKFGAFIRKFSIDELPQFFNVLKGEMSLVGPRPEVPHYVAQFREDVPRYMVKHQVRPGITGWAQVNGFRGDTSIEARINHDIYYIEHWSFFFDIKILFLTLFKGIVNAEQL